MAENYFLGARRPVRGAAKVAMKAEAAASVDRLGVHLDVDAPVAELGRAEQQILEIVRALGGKAGRADPRRAYRIVEPRRERAPFSIVGQLRDESWAILYITHRLEEVNVIGDRVTVFRDGRVVGTSRRRFDVCRRASTDDGGPAVDALYPAIPATRWEKSPSNWTR